MIERDLSRTKRNKQELPVALTVAGSDSGGGGGVQADLKTFASLGVHGTSAVTCLTAQNPKGVSGMQACRAELVVKQIEAVASEFHPAAVKTGMLFSSSIIRATARALRQLKSVPVVVDPVMVATSGAPLLQPRAVRDLRTHLFSIATLITPNVDEACELSGMRIRDPEDLRICAKRLYSKFGCAVLVKGGHLSKLKEAIDIFYDGTTELLLSAPFVRRISTHGTGCTYSSAIAAYLACGRNLRRSVELAKEYISCTIAQSYSVGRHTALNHFWKK